MKLKLFLVAFIAFCLSVRAQNWFYVTNDVSYLPPVALSAQAGEVRLTVVALQAGGGATPAGTSQWVIVAGDGFAVQTVTGTNIATSTHRFRATLSAGSYSALATVYPSGQPSFAISRTTLTITNAGPSLVVNAASSNTVSVGPVNVTNANTITATAVVTNFTTVNITNTYPTTVYTQGVASVNTLTGNVTLAVSGGLTITTNTSTLTISGSGIGAVTNGGATINGGAISNGAAISITPSSIGALSNNVLRVPMMAVAAEIYGSTNDAVIIGQSGTSANWTELQFSDTVEQRARWTIPAAHMMAWNGGQLTNRITWYSSLATTSAVVWSIALRTVGSGAVMDASYSTVRLVTNPPSTTTSGLVYSDIVFTPATNELVNGQLSVFELRRKPTDLGDLSATNANVIGVMLFQ